MTEEFKANSEDYVQLEDPKSPDTLQIKILETPQFTLTSSAFIIGAVYTVTLLSAWLLTYLMDGITTKILEVFIIDIIGASIIFTFSIVFQNSSVFDPYWFIAPIIMAWYWFESAGKHTPPGILAVVAITVYGVRHFGLFFRTWPGLSYEDFRYRDLKVLMQNNPVLYWICSYFAYHLIPACISFSGIVPLYYVFFHQWNVRYLWLTIVGFSVAFAGLVLETVADEQLYQWRLRGRGDCIDQGLWRYSRHPNYLGEAIFWIGVYVMSLGCGFEYWWTGFGPLAIIGMLYFISIPWMEAHLLKTKTEYAEYYALVSKFMFGPRKTFVVSE